MQTFLTSVVPSLAMLGGVWLYILNVGEENMALHRRRQQVALMLFIGATVLLGIGTIPTPALAANFPALPGGSFFTPVMVALACVAALYGERSANPKLWTGIVLLLAGPALLVSAVRSWF